MDNLIRTTEEQLTPRQIITGCGWITQNWAKILGEKLSRADALCEIITEYPDIFQKGLYEEEVIDTLCGALSAEYPIAPPKPPTKPAKPAVTPERVLVNNCVESSELHVHVLDLAGCLANALSSLMNGDSLALMRIKKEVQKIQMTLLDE